MIRKVRDIGFKNIKNNKFIIISSIFSIMISLIIFISMFNFILNSEETLKENIYKIYGNMDISITYTKESKKEFTKKVVDKILNQEGIKESSVVLIDFLTVDKNDIYTVGLEDDDLSKSRYKYSGSLNENSVIINTGLAQRLNKNIGDSVEINNKTFIIKEILENDKNNSSIPNMLIMNINNLRELSGKFATGIMIKIDKESTDSISFANKLKENIDKDIESEITEENEAVKGNLQNLKVIVSILGFLTLIMSSYLILINFDTFLYKYRKDFSTLRSIGSSSKQCFKIVFIQSTFINVIGCFLGFSISYILNSKILNLIKPIFNFEIAVYKFNYIESLIITLIVMILIEGMMLIPAYKSSKILPLKIKEENENLDFKTTSNILPYFVYFISFSIYFYGVVVKKDKLNSTIFAVVASIFFIIGTIIYVKRNIQNILNKLLVVIKKLFGVYSFIAIKNMIPQVKRYFSIIMSISILFMIITFSTSMFNIIESNDVEYTKNTNPGDITVKSVLRETSKLDYSIIEDINKLDKNSKVSFISQSMTLSTNITNDILSVGVIDIKPFIENKIIDVDNNINLEDKILIKKDFATKNNLKIGSKIELSSYEYGETIDDKIEHKIGEFTVIGILDELPNVTSNVAVDVSSKASAEIYNKLDKENLNKFEKLIIFTENPKEYGKVLESIKGKYPELKWTITDDLLKENRDYLFQRWSMLIIVIGAILFIVILGTINSLINDMNNRRSEYALLRVLELKQSKVVQVILTQALTYITIGLLIGLITGEIITIIINSAEGSFSLGLNIKVLLIFSILIYMLVISIITPFAIKISKNNIITELKSEV